MNRVLFVDDEALILNSLKRGLMDEPYERFFATSGEDALKVLAKNEISVLVTDMKMPGMSGLDLLKAVKEPYPDLVKLVLSGYTQLPQVLVTVNQGDIFKFITKPWDLEEFKDIIGESLDYYNYRLEVKKAREALEKKNVTFQNILKTYDDKILSMRDEVLFMKDMNEKLVKGIVRKINRWDPKTNHKSVLLDDIAQSEELLLEAFQLIPTQVKRFSPKQIIDELRKHVTDNQMLKHVEFGIDNRMNKPIKGRYDLLYFTLKKMLTLLIVEEFDAQVGIVISGVDMTDSELLFKAVMEADDKWFVKGPAAEATFAWLAEWVAGFGGELLVKDVGAHKAMVLNIVCEN